MAETINYEFLDRRIGELIAENLGEGHEVLQGAGLAAIMTALLIRAARADGTISDSETHEILASLQETFEITGAKALELVNTVSSQLASGDELLEFLRGLRLFVTDEDRETVLLLLLRLIAADGKRATAELAVFQEAVDALAISEQVVHKVFDQYFAETFVDDSAG